MHIVRVDICHDKFPVRDRHPFNLEQFQKTDGLDFTTPVTLFAGENGTGKSTLLEALCRRCGIHIWEGMERSRAEHNPFEKMLERCLRVEWEDGRVPGSFFAANLFRNYAQLIDEWGAITPETFERVGGKSLVTQSHGQSLLSYFRARYRIKGLYFLDEPETALSPKSQLALLRLLVEMSDAGHAQFIVVSHSPILLACPGAKIYTFDTTPIAPIAYEETDYFRVYKEFLERRTPAPERGSP